MRRVCDADGREKHGGSRLLLPGSIDAVVLPQLSIVVSVSLRTRGAKGGYTQFDGGFNRNVLRLSQILQACENAQLAKNRSLIELRFWVRAGREIR